MLPLQEYPGLLITVARRRTKQAVLARAARHGLSVQQFWMVVTLAEQPGATLSAIAERMDVDLPTASRVLAAILKRGAVRAETDRADRRRAKLHLTPAGQALARRLKRDADEIRAAIVSGMSRSEVDALRAGLRRVISNMDRLLREEDAEEAS